MSPQYKKFEFWENRAKHWWRQQRHSLLPWPVPGSSLEQLSKTFPSSSILSLPLIIHFLFIHSLILSFVFVLSFLSPSVHHSLFLLYRSLSNSPIHSLVSFPNSFVQSFLQIFTNFLFSHSLFQFYSLLSTHFLIHLYVHTLFSFSLSAWGDP